jgi:excisionase family DNA binding protein
MWNNLLQFHLGVLKMAENQYLTKREAANLMRCSVITISRMVNDGLLRKIKLRGKVLFNQAEIQNLLNGGVTA